MSLETNSHESSHQRRLRVIQGNHQRVGHHRIRRAVSLGLVIALVGFAVISIVSAMPAAAQAVSPATTQQSWKLLANPSPADALLLGSVCVDAWNCWSVGGTIGNGNNDNTFRGALDHWNGTSWSNVPSERPGGNGWLFTSVSCPEADDCWAVGAELNQGSPPVPLSEHWNGSTWSIVAQDDVAGYLLGVSCISVSSCWAVGPRADAGGNTDGLVLDRWNGATWTVVAAPPVGEKYSALDSVACAGTSECFAVGWDGPNAQNTGFLPVFPAEAGGKALIERWNGSSWTSVSAPQAPEGTYLSGATCVGPSDCFAVGALTNGAGNAESALVDHWDGTSWSSSTVSGFPNETGDFLHQVTCLNASYCLAAGSSGLENAFNQGIEPAVAVWNGSEWSGTSVSGSYVVGMLEGIACAGRAECLTSGFIIAPNNNNVAITSIQEELALPQGYRIAASDGGVFNFGSDGFHGSLGAETLAAPVVGMTSADAEGYWLAGSDGGVFTFGDASFLGSMGGKQLNAPVVGISAHGERGYRLVGSDGGVFSFGDAAFDGSMAGRRLVAPIVGIAATPDGGGYWLVGSDGGVFCFGDATFHGSEGGHKLGAPIVGIAPTPDGNGYWLVGSDGGVFSFGDAGFHGSEAGHKLGAPIVAMTASPDGGGYWIVGSDGGVFSLGDAGFLGSEAGKRIVLPVVAGA